jgi:ribose transport system substrate-binding protein
VAQVATELQFVTKSHHIVIFSNQQSMGVMRPTASRVSGEGILRMDPVSRRSLSKRAAVFSAAMAVLVALAACSSSSSSTSSGASTSSNAAATGSASSSGVAQANAAATKALAMPTSITQTTPLASKAPSGKSIIFVSNGLAATERIATGVHEAADAIGWSYSEIHFDAANPATLESALLTALAKKPSAVAEAGSPQSTFGTSTIAAYKAAGVPIILGSVAPILLGDPIYGTPAGEASEQVVGKDLADWFIANSDGKGKAILENYTSAPVLDVFRDAFIAEVKALCPDCSTKVVAVTQADVDAGTLITKVIAAARTNPSYKYIFFDNGQFADGILSALSAAGLSGLIIGGRSIDPYGKEALAAGTEAVWTGQSYYLQGEAMVDVALRTMLGAPGSSNNDVIPVQLITKANVSQMTGQFYNFPTSSLQQYEKLWGVPTTACKLTCS